MTILIGDDFQDLNNIYSSTIPQTVGGALQNKMFRSGAAGRLPNPIVDLTWVFWSAALKARNLNNLPLNIKFLFNFSFIYFTVSLFDEHESEPVLFGIFRNSLNWCFYVSDLPSSNNIVSWRQEP